MPSISQPLILKCYFCYDQFAYTNPWHSPEFIIPNIDSVNVLRKHLIEYHKFPPNITSSEVRYILKLIMKENISGDVREKSMFPEKLNHFEFYQNQLFKIFIHFLCHNPENIHIPNESEHTLFPHEIDKIILDGKEPPSQLYLYDTFYMEYDEEWWMNKEYEL